MTVTLTSKYTKGDRVPWCAPYGMETVTIAKVYFNDYTRKFYYETEEYNFALDEGELR